MHPSIWATHSGVRCCMWIRGQVEVPPSHLKVIKSPLLIFWWTLNNPGVCLTDHCRHEPAISQSLTHQTSVRQHIGQTLHTNTHRMMISQWNIHYSRVQGHTHTSKWAAATHLHYRLAFFNYIYFQQENQNTRHMHISGTRTMDFLSPWLKEKIKDQKQVFKFWGENGTEQPVCDFFYVRIPAVKCLVCV